MATRTNDRNMRVQVERTALIKAIERKQAQCQKDYERLGEKHAKEVEKWRKDLVAQMREETKLKVARTNELSKMPLKDIVAAAQKGGYLHLKVGGQTLYPPNERKGEQLDGFGNILRMLRMSKKDSVSLSEKQFKAYMDGCPI